MANTKTCYFKGEDHNGNVMYARQRGPADPSIVGRMFGMKDVKEITEAQYNAATAPVAPATLKDPPKEKAGNGERTIKNTAKMKAKELRAYGKELGLAFPVGMKNDDMRAAISLAFTTPEAEVKDGEASGEPMEGVPAPPDGDTKTALPPDGDTETALPPDGDTTPEDMTKAAGMADQEND